MDNKSPIARFFQARVYYRASRAAYKYAKVTFAYNLSYRVSYYFHHSMHQTEAWKWPSLTTNRVHHLCIHCICESDTAHLLEGISSRVTRTAQSLYRCYLSCKDAFPTPDMQDELAKDVWEEACIREGAHPSLPRPDGKAGLFLATCGLY